MKSRLILQVLCLLLCASPNLYGQFPVNCIDYAVVYGPGGASEVVTCEGDGLAETYNFGTSSLAMPFGFLITDENDIIIKVSIDNTLSFEGLGQGGFKVYAFSFIGQVTAQPGQNATTTQLGSICGALTTNFIPITNYVPDGGNIATSDGNTSQLVCPDDNVDDTIQFMTTGDQSVNYAYLITDENNIIQDITNGDSYDFGGSAIGTYRVWGVSYAGNLTAMIGDDAANTPLSDDCFGLSDNFIEVTVAQPDGATVSLTNGETETTICVADGQADVLTFVNQSTATSAYVYLVTDENNTVLAVVNGDNFDFEPAAPGTCRVWGVSYTGAFTAVPGDNAATVDLSDGCFDLSDNFIEVVRQAAVGGMVTTDGGATEVFACVADGVADEFTFVNNSTIADNYVYLITDEDNIILAINTDGVANFEGADIGTCRVWGLAYGGTLLAEEGDDATSVILADGCFGLSDNFVSIRRESVEGGTVAMPSGNTTRYTCPGDGNADIVEFTNTGSSTGEYVYVITDDNLSILAVTSDSNFDFDGAPAGTCLVWGLAYTGNLTAGTGADASTTSLSDECFDLSDNFITVIRETPEGGAVAMPNGNTVRYTCPGDGIADIVMFDSSGTSSGSYAYVITDENNVILGFPTDDSFDFDGAPAGICRVWGLAYTGNVTAVVGDTASVVALTDDCFDLSDNFISVVRETPDGGAVAMPNGNTVRYTCPGDGIADIVMFDSTGTSSGPYAYVITDENNVILGFPTDDSFDFDGAPEGICRVWGLAYTGNVTAVVGDTASVVALTDDCFDLSANFITVIRQLPDGGTLSFSDGSNLQYTCPGDGMADELTFEAVDTVGPSFTYLITDEQNIVLGLAPDASFDFDGAPEGICRVWGLAYNGNLTTIVGDTTSIAALSDDCFDLSDNFLAVIRQVPDGGTVSMPNGETTRYTCPGDGTPDIVSFDSIGVTITPYAYVITDENNVILGFPTGDSFDFDGAPEGICRVWGLAYTGNVTAVVGDTASVVALTDDCFDLSDNFITVIRQFPDAGQVAIEDGTIEAFLCSDSGANGTLEFDSLQTSNTPYVYLITDTDNIILDIVDVDNYNFSGLASGTYRVWGLAYTGNLLATIGGSAENTLLSDDCFDLSDNIVLVVNQPTDGGVVTAENDPSLTTCPGDGNPDIIEFSNTGLGANYVYVVTDEANVIITTTDQNSIDFDIAGIGICRVWGLAYTGNITAMPGDTASTVLLTDDCFDLSDNFITVVREVPDAGTIATEDGETTVYTCPGDGNDDFITVDSSGVIGTFAYVITDENNVILDVPSGDSFNFDGAPEGICRIWGLAYSGNLIAAVGDTASVISLSDDCFDLSDNFVTVIRMVPEGGTVATPTGETEVLICPGDGTPDVVQFDSSGTTGIYAYVVTDTNNVILGLVDGDSFDFDNAPEGVCRVWGLAYTGNVTAVVGDTASLVALTDDCFDLSDNFITVTRQSPEGGSITSQLGSVANICVGDDVADNIEFLVTGASSGNYLYLITDSSDVLLSAFADPFFDFDGIVPDEYRVYGLAYTGLPNLTPGDNINDVPLSNDCFDLTDDFITIFTTGVDGAIIFSSEGVGEDILYLCVGDGLPNEITFFNTTSANDASFAFAITNEDNIVIGFLPPNNTFDFEIAGAGIANVYGISYTGNLLLGLGQNILDVMISDGCYDLSDNSIFVIRDQPESGLITTLDGETDILVCDDGDGAEVFFSTSNNITTGLVYLLTDTDNNALEVFENLPIDFAQLPLGEYNVWALSYTGFLNDFIGQDVTATELATSCYELSQNFVAVSRGPGVDGGAVSTIFGQDIFYTCSNDDVFDIIPMITTSADTTYTYIITDGNDNVIVSDVEESVIPFEGAADGIYHIWGLSYYGDLLYNFGDNVLSTPASDSCFALSENFVTVVRETPEGGTILTNEGADAITVIVGDSLSDETTFISLGNSDFLPYVYVVTDTNNVILAVSTSPIIDFEGADPGICRVWGLAYAGNLVAMIGDDADEVALADDCWDLTDNFVTVTRVDAGFQDDSNESFAAGNEIIQQVKIAPNPATNYTIISFELSEMAQATSSLQILDGRGQLIETVQIASRAGQNQYELAINNWSGGMYIAFIQNGSEVQAKKFIVIQ